MNVRVGWVKVASLRVRRGILLGRTFRRARVQMRGDAETLGEGQCHRSVEMPLATSDSLRPVRCALHQSAEYGHRAIPMGGRRGSRTGIASSSDPVAAAEHRLVGAESPVTRAEDFARQGLQALSRREMDRQRDHMTAEHQL